MHHHCALLPQSLKGLRHRIKQVGLCHTQDLTIGAQGVHQRAKQIEHGAHTQTAAQGRQIDQGRMPGRCE